MPSTAAHSPAFLTFSPNFGNASAQESPAQTAPRRGLGRVMASPPARRNSTVRCDGAAVAATPIRPTSATETQMLHMDKMFVAVSKPPHLLVHRNTRLDRHATHFCDADAAQHAGVRKVYPVNRIDRATSGIVLFALPDSENGEAENDNEAVVEKNEEDSSGEEEADGNVIEQKGGNRNARKLQEAINSADCEKYYIALVRGSTPIAWESKRPLTNHDSRLKVKRDAHTSFERLLELPVSRCSLLRIRLHTGRRHQIRRHLQHEAHHILGDRKYGKSKDNAYHATNFQLPRLFLHSRRLIFVHPETRERIRIECPVSEDLVQYLYRLPDFDPDVHAAQCDLW